MSMENINEFDMLIIEYIQKTYKVSRIKYEMKFRRAMILDDGAVYPLKDESTTKKIRFKIASFISLIFACNEDHANKLVAKALSI